MNPAADSSLHLMRAPRRVALLWLLLVALFARGLVAPGFMPRVDAQGVGIVLCTPQGPRTVWPAGDAPQAHVAGEQHCAFGLALGMAALPVLPATLSLVPATAPDALPAVAPVSRAVPTPYSARGPPSYS